VTAKIGCDNVEMAAQIHRDPIPVAAVIAGAVDEDEERLVMITPIDKVQLKTLRIEGVRGRTDDAFKHAGVSLR